MNPIPIGIYLANEIEKMASNLSDALLYNSAQELRKLVAENAQLRQHLAFASTRIAD